MQERIDKELALLRQAYPDLEYQPEGRWVRVPAYPLPPGWNRGTTDVAFDIPSEFPGGPPYGIHVPAGLTFNEQRPENYAEPSSKQPPFGGTWGVLSWTTVDGRWRATVEPDPARGYIVRLELLVDQTFVPAEQDSGATDTRELGVRVFHVHLEPLPAARP